MVETMDEEISALIALLGDAQYDAYKLAAKKLRRIGPPAATAIRELLDSPNPVILVRAARLLGEIGDTDSAPLLKNLHTEGLPDVASAVATALAQLRRVSKTDEAAQKAVAEVHLRQAVKRQREGTDVWKPPQHEDRSEAAARPALSARRRVALTLPTGIDGLIATLSSQDYARRLAASNALVERGCEAVPALIQTLKHPASLVRLRALDALGKIGDDDALPAVARYFVEATSAQEWETAASALLPLSERIAERARPELLDGYIDLVRVRSHPGASWLPITACIEGAKCLEAVASSAPGPELRRALAHLKGIRPFVPAEFVRARVAIEAATAAWSALPLPAEEPVATYQNLPTPAQAAAPAAENLPAPAAAEPPVAAVVPKTRVRLPIDLPSLIPLLGSDDEATARLAEGTLLLRGAETVLPLWRAYDDVTPKARDGIVRLLCRFADPRSLPMLWWLWVERPEPSLRTAALDAGEALYMEPGAISLDALLVVLTESRHALPALASHVARALERRAETEPWDLPTLERVLSFLPGSLPLHRALDSRKKRAAP